MNITTMILLMIIIIIVSFALIASLGGRVRGSLPVQVQETFQKFVDVITFKSSYNICEAYTGKEISQQDFQTLLQAVYSGRCGDSHATVTLTQSFTRDDMKKIARIGGIAQNGDLIFYNFTEPLGVGGVIIQGNPGYYPMKIGDTIEIWQAGKPEPDVFMKVVIHGCDPTDEVCDVTCNYKKICDPVCDDGKKHYIQCNLACIDSNNDGKIDEEDARARIDANKCNPDCYVNVTNTFKAYDPGCVWKYRDTKDGICDPNSNGVKDGVCDPDCLDSPMACDPDCNGTNYEGNPSGYNDTKCYVCDKTCNGFCSPSCKPGEDPDCQGECDGNGICNTDAGENCLNAPKDCMPICTDQNAACCPLDSGADQYGCTTKLDLKEGEECSCASQCNSTSLCSLGHCCPGGSFWNGTGCSQSSDVLIVTMKSNLKKVYSDAQIQKLEDKIKDYINGLAQDGLGGVLIYLDDKQTEDIVGKQVPPNTNAATTIDGVLDLLIPKLKAKYLIIIGGDQRVQQPDYVGSRTGSDDPYGDITGDYVPDIPVGRIPDPNNGDLDVMLNTLDTAASLHRSGGVDLSNYVVPTMGCGGYDARPWNSGKCFCSGVLNIATCAGKCGCLSLSDTSGKGFVVMLSHGPGPSSSDLLEGGCISGGPSSIAGLDVKDAVWMVMACGGGHLKMKDSTSGSNTMTFLKSGGAVFFGSTNNNLGGMGGCPVPGGDGCIGTLYALTAMKFSVGKRIGDAYKEGKAEYLTGKYNQGGCDTGYQGHINVLYGDPSLKIIKMWS